MKDNQNLSIGDIERYVSQMLDKAEKDPVFANTPLEPIWGLLTEESLRDIKDNLVRERTEVKSSENRPYQITPGLFTGKGGKILIIDAQIKEIEHELSGRIDE